MNKNKIFFDDKINLILIKNIIFKKFKKIISGVIIFTLIGVAVSLLTPPLYKSTLTLYPSQKDSSSSIGSLASMATNFVFPLPFLSIPIKNNQKIVIAARFVSHPQTGTDQKHM